MDIKYALPPLAAFLLSPLMLGVINRVKAQCGGRRGPPLVQVYYDLWRLLHKGAVYSRTATWIFRAGPTVALSALIVATLLMPLGSCPAALEFRGDLILFTYLLALARLSIVLAALDVGSSFEGMGASREVLFSRSLSQRFCWASRPSRAIPASCRCPACTRRCRRRPGLMPR